MSTPTRTVLKSSRTSFISYYRVSGSEKVCEIYNQIKVQTGTTFLLFQFVCSCIGPGISKISAGRRERGVLKYFKKKRRNIREIIKRKYIHYNKIVSLNVNFGISSLPLVYDQKYWQSYCVFLWPPLYCILSVQAINVIFSKTTCIIIGQVILLKIPMSMRKNYS